METSLRTAARNNVEALIRESRMISDIVTSITEYVGECLKEKLRTALWTVKPGKGPVSKKEGEFDYNNIGISFKVKWRLENHEIQEKDDAQVFKCSAHADYKVPLLEIVVAAVNGRYCRNDLYETIQHEVSHFFERGKRGKEYKTAANYNLAIKKMDDNKTVEEEAVARAIYICHKFEQRAFANGAYQYLMKSTDFSNKFENSIKYTRLYGWMVGAEELRMFLSQCTDTKDDIEKYCKQYGYTLNKLLKLLNRTINNMAKIAERVKSKAIDDSRRIYGVHERKEYTPLNEAIERQKKVDAFCRQHFRPYNR